MLAAAAALTLLATPVAAADFSENSEAKEWGLLGEEKARFSAKVVDIACELTGDCVDNCGAGSRQLGLLREADGVLVLAMKNGQPAFTGAVVDLLPYCEQTVEVDGVLIGDEETAPAKFYMVQMVRTEGGEWAKANLWTKEWAERHPEEAKEKGPWFRKDPVVNAAIAEKGYLGLGAEADKAFIEYYFQ